MGRWWKTEITSGPTAPARFCPWEPHLFKKRLFMSWGTGLIFVPISMYIWEGGKMGSECFLQYKAKTLCSRCYFAVWQRVGAQKLCVPDVFFFFFLFIGIFPSRASGNLHSSHSVRQLSVPYCINPSNLLCVCLNIRLSSVLAAALRWENTSRN